MREQHEEQEVETMRAAVANDFEKSVEERLEC